jgi:hypothetical protein
MASTHQQKTSPAKKGIIFGSGSIEVEGVSQVGGQDREERHAGAPCGKSTLRHAQAAFGVEHQSPKSNSVVQTSPIRFVPQCNIDARINNRRHRFHTTPQIPPSASNTCHIRSVHCIKTTIRLLVKAANTIELGHSKQTGTDRVHESRWAAMSKSETTLEAIL